MRSDAVASASRSHPATSVDPSPDLGIVVPIRSFTDANTRLRATLDPTTRSTLARAMAERVLGITDPHPVVIVSSAPEVETWAQEFGAGERIVVVDDPGTGLDAAAAAGRSVLQSLGCRRIVVIHADLPRASSLDPVIEATGLTMVTLVPCHREDGTNVISLPATAEFEFSYGPGSFRRHVAEVERLGLELRVVRPPDLTADVDTADDLRFVEPALLEPTRSAR